MISSNVLEVVTTETFPKAIQFRENGAPKDLTGFTITCKIGTDPLTIKTATVADPSTGTGHIIFSGLPPGTFDAEIIMTNIYGILPSERFVISVREGL